MKRIHSRTVLCFALALILGLSGLSGCRREDENRAEAENPHAMSVSLREGTAVGTSDVPAETDAPTEKAEADAPVEADLPPETEAKTEDPPAPDMPAESRQRPPGRGSGRSRSSRWNTASGSSALTGTGSGPWAKTV